MISVYTQPMGVETTADNWWFIVDKDNNVKVPPKHSSGATFSPNTLVVADTLAECLQYISDNNIGYTPVD